MKKVISMIFGLAAALLVASCADVVNREILANSDAEYGTLILQTASDSRVLSTAELTTATVTVSGYGMEDVSVSDVAISGGKGSVVIEKIKVGKNRVVKVQSNITGGVLYKVIPEISSGENTVSSINWNSTAVGAVYYNLIKNGVDVSAVSESDFSSAISTSVHASLVDAASIATDFASGSLKAASSYILSTGTVTATVYGYNGKSVYIADPASSAKTASSSAANLSFTGVYPGTWNVYADGTKATSVKVTAGGTTAITVGQPTDKIIVHWKNVKGSNIYAWSTDSSQTQYFGAWPGKTDSTADSYGYYSATIPATSSYVIFNGNGQTADLKISKPGEYWWLGTETATDSDWTTTDPNAKKETDNVTLSKITVNGKSATINGTTATYSASGTDDTFSITSVSATATDSAATITYSATKATLTDGKSSSFKITVKNGSKTATYTLTVSYTKRDTPVSAGQYGTNDKGFGKNATISSWSDWSEDMQIARGAAYDDPRTWTGIQEVPYDAYALYAAYDDTNLYIMVELTNIVDRASFMFHDYAASDNAWWNNRDIPLGLAINTGASTLASGPYMSGGSSVIWGGANGGIEFTDSNGFDWLLYHSSKYGTFAGDGTFVGVGTPGFFHVQSDGYFSYDDSACLSVNTGTTKGTSGIDIKYMRQCAVSKTVNYESTPTDNRTTSGQTGEDLMASENYTSVKTGDLDMSYWYTIPLSTLGITKSYIESNGIGIRQLTTGGGSLMDCLPWDTCMVDVASEYYSGADDFSSKEKEDVDNITSSQARVGR